MKKITSFSQVTAGTHIRMMVTQDGFVLIGVLEIFGKRMKSKNLFLHPGDEWMIRAKYVNKPKNNDESYIFEHLTITKKPFTANGSVYSALCRFDSRTWTHLKNLYKQGDVYNRALTEFITGYQYSDEDWEYQCDDWARGFSDGWITDILL